ncbi:MAG: hypothetical protein ABJ310_18155 [Roseobacter sp.]
MRQPSLYAAILVLLVTRFDLNIPMIEMITTDLLGSMMIPAMLILLRASLASLKIGDMKSAFGIAFARLMFGLLPALLVIWMQGLGGIAEGTISCLRQCPLPSSTTCMRINTALMEE